MKVAIIIPCFNEAKSIRRVLAEITHLQKDQPQHEFVAVPVNDCSTDNTLEVLLTTNTSFINLPINLGIGGAVQTGFRFAYEEQFDIAIQVDGDGQHPVQAIPLLLEPLINEHKDIVIGSRFIRKTGFQSTLLRRLGILIIKNSIAAFTRVRVSDPTSGFRAYNRHSLRILADDYPDDFPEPVALVPLLLLGLKVKEVPVEMRERSEGVSSIKHWKTVYYMLKVVLAIFFRYLKFKFYGKRSAH